jgi:beta-lactam-binding protein with PASTA domain
MNEAKAPLQLFQTLKITIFKFEKKTRDYFSAKGADIYTRFVRRMFFVFILACLTAVIVAIIVLFISSIAGPIVKVPSVTGLNVINASIALQEKGLSVEIDSKFDTNTPKFTVIEQLPQQGLAVRKGRTVILLVSMGKDVYIVPSLTGLKREEAEQILTKLNISYDITVIQSHDYPVDTVISQDIQPNHEVDRSVKMKLLVNSDIAEGQFRVADYSRQSLELVAKTLIANSIQPVIQEEPVQNPDEDGLIISQNILSNSIIPRNSEIHLQVGVFEDDAVKRQKTRFRIFSFKLENMSTISSNETGPSQDDSLNKSQANVKIMLTDEANDEKEIYNQTQNYGNNIILCFKTLGKAKLTLIVDNNFVKEIPYE